MTEVNEKKTRMKMRTKRATGDLPVGTLTRSMFLCSSNPLCKPHKYLISFVLPHPVSPITTTGIPHLRDKLIVLKIKPSLSLPQGLT
jgi:hypothetical protein